MKSRDITLPTKVCYVKAMVLSSRHVQMWELQHKEVWVPKNWCSQILVLEKTLESPLDSKEIKPANPKGNQSWTFTGRTDAEAEAPILWLSDAESWLIRKDPDAGKDWRQEGKGATENEMVDGILDSMDMNWSKLWEIVEDRDAWHTVVYGVTKMWTQLSDSTATIQSENYPSFHW